MMSGQGYSGDNCMSKLIFIYGDFEQVFLMRKGFLSLSPVLVFILELYPKLGIFEAFPPLQKKA